MKKTAFLLIALAGAAMTALAAEPAPALTVTAQDLLDAGYASAKELKPAGDRFQPPVHYFRVSPALSALDAKKDCKDCGDLAAVYAAVTTSAPAWIDRTDLVYSAGGRVQIRRWLAARKIAVIVSAPDRTLAIKLANDLVKRYAQ